MRLNFTTPVFNKQVHTCQFFFNFLWIRRWQIRFIDCKYNRNTGSLGVRNSLFGLRHYIIICSDYNNRNICYLCTTSTHRRKGFVTGSIQEGHSLTVLKLYPVGSNMLCNTTTFPGNNIFFTNIIQQRSFTVVNVTHYSHNWRSIFKIFWIFRNFFYCLLDICSYKIYFVTKFICNNRKCFSI